MRVHEHVDAWKHRCQQHVDGHTWTAGSEPTDVAHVIVSIRRMGRGPREVILLLCPVWVSWFDVSTRTSSPQRGVIVTARGPFGPDRMCDTVAKIYCSAAGNVAAAQYFPASPIPETEREADQVK